MVSALCFAVWIITLLGSRKLLGESFNPLTNFVSVWTLLIAAYSLKLLPYYDLDARTWLIIMSSMGAFALGCILAVATRTRAPGSRLNQGMPDLLRLKRLIILLYGIGITMLAVWISQIEGRYTIAGFLSAPWLLRRDIGDREVGWAFRYFYFTIPAGILAFLYTRLAKKSSWLMRTIIATSIISGLATTGRTAILWPAVWLAYLMVYAQRSSRSPSHTLRRSVKVSLTIAASFVLFTQLGNWMGKTFQNSGFAIKTNVDGRLTSMVIPYHYFVSSLPAFQNLVREPSEQAWGSHTFLPLMKTLGLFTTVPETSEISPETSTPFPGNTYTYLWPYYCDFGLVGVIFGPLLLGFILMAVHLRLVGARPSLGLLYTNSLLATVVAFSFGTNRLISAPTWWFLLVGGIAEVVSRRNVVSSDARIRLRGQTGYRARPSGSRVPAVRTVWDRQDLSRLT